TKRSAAVDSRADRAGERRADELDEQVMQTAARAPTRPAFAPPAPLAEAQRPAAASTSAHAENPGVTSDEQHEQTRHDPEEWLREIRELRAAGKTEDADREWKAFRETFPD